MKRASLWTVVVLLTLVITSCDLLGSVFGPGKNDIAGWVPTYKVGARFSYSYRETYEDGSTAGTSTSTVEVTSVEERSSLIVVRISVNGSPGYYIIDTDNGELLESSDEYVDANDWIDLKTPVEEGAVWYNGTNTKMTIQSIGKKSVAAGDFDHVVTVRVTDPDWTVTDYQEWYYCPKGFLGFKYKYLAGSGWGEDTLELTNIDLP